MEKILKELEKIKKEDSFGFEICVKKLDDNFLNIKNTFEIAKLKKWDKVWMFCDIHSTILKPDYNNVSNEYYPLAKKTLQKISKRKDISLCLFTCSYPKEINEYLKFFKKDKIIFDHCNKNPEAENTKFGFFEQKPYMNILLEDKAGFNAETDWYVLNEIIDKYKISL